MTLLAELGGLTATVDRLLAWAEWSDRSPSSGSCDNYLTDLTLDPLLSSWGAIQTVHLSAPRLNMPNKIIIASGNGANCCAP